jgi:hypothetical protein
VPTSISNTRIKTCIMKSAMEWNATEDTAMYLRDASRALHALEHANGLPVVRHALQAILARATLRRERRTTDTAPPAATWP